MNRVLAGKKVVFFDVGYTIDYPASGDWMFTRKFHEVAGERIQNCSEEQIRQARNVGMDYLERNHFIRDEKEEVAVLHNYYKIISEELELGLKPEELETVAADRAYNMENYVIYPDAKQVIQNLSETYRLGIISDTWPSIDNQLRTLGVIQYFSFATYSFELGVFKPDKRMYLDALHKCGCDAKETVFIDDSPVNLEGAESVGITPILIAANPASDVETPYLKIHTLSELICSMPGQY